MDNTKKLPFTFTQIEQSIPSHLFKRDLAKSLSYVAWDLVETFLNAVIFLLVEPYVSAAHWSLWLLLFAVYSFIQGATLTGLWVLAHECGHGAFSENQDINDLVGYFLHTCLYVPYFSWQHSHASHHHYTNNIQKDEVWVPQPDEIQQQQTGAEAPRKSLLDAWKSIILSSTVGWPLYLLINVTGHVTKDFASHFLPGCSLFPSKLYWKVQLSTVGILIWTACLYYLGAYVTGFSFLAKMYGGPLIVVFFFLTTITYMQHTHEKIPHYDDKEWTWLKGALCTVDRTMGSYLDKKLHYIHYTHVCHHLFSKLPFYNSLEATKYIKETVGEHYMREERNYFLSLVDTFRDSAVITPDKRDTKRVEGVYWWWTKNNSV